MPIAFQLGGLLARLAVKVLICDGSYKSNRKALASSFEAVYIGPMRMVAQHRKVFGYAKA